MRQQGEKQVVVEQCGKAELSVIQIQEPLSHSLAVSKDVCLLQSEEEESASACVSFQAGQ